MALTGKEIDSLILKIRNQYRENAQEYSEKWFSLSAFEERLDLALKSKMDMESFLLAEVSNLEKIKERFQEKQKKSQFQSKLDTIAEERHQKIENYPEGEIHPRASEELSRFYGAMGHCFRLYLPALNLVLRGFEEEEQLFRLERELAMIAKPQGKNPPPRIEDHQALLNTPGIPDIEIEKNRNRILMDGAFVLHDLVSMTDRLIAYRHQLWDEPVLLEHSHAEKEDLQEMKELFEGKTGYGIFLDAREFCQDVLDNFRLGAFKRSSKR